MPSAVPGLPPDRASVELDDGRVSLLLDESLYPRAAVYGAAYVFLDRCYVLLDAPQAGRWRVTLADKAGGADEAALRALVGELANELLSCAWRHQITIDNRAVIEATTMQAMAGAMGPPSLDELADFDFTEEPFDDPLGIAVSWEDKYGNKRDPDAGE